MLVSKLNLRLRGYVIVKVEGFFIQRFMNLCIGNGIFLKHTKHVSKTEIITSIYKDDFKALCKIAKKTNCKVKIKKKYGIPFWANRYRKRKIFFALFIIVGIVAFSITKFVWNIEINSSKPIDEDAIIKLLDENGVKKGVLISKINSEEIINKIRLDRDDIAWIGIDIKGTNIVINIVTADEKPEIVDNTKINNIVSNKAGIITRISAQSGTAKVEVGESVEEGSVLIEGVMEGKYTGVRYVNARGDVYAKITYTKTEKEFLKTEKNTFTGNEEEKYNIKFNNFKINLNKGVSNFENYDTIVANKKIRIFSDYYLPIAIEKITYREIQKEQKEYTIEEITNELKTKLENQILDELNNEYEEFIESSFECDVNGNVVTVVVKCIVEEKIGVDEDLVF